jgi:hypothetical protein
MSPEPFAKIAGTAPDRASALQSREALLVEIRLRDFGCFHGFLIVARLALSD